MAIGDGALESNTTGTRHTAVGFQTLQNCIAAPDFAGNTAIGAQALFSDTTGNFNTAIGDAAMKLNTTGGANTAIGLDALVFNDTGDSNTAVGANALFSNTQGIENTAIGTDAAINNLTGNLNTAFGEAALNDNLTGSTNTAIGSNTLLHNTGNGNTALGGRRQSGRATGALRLRLSSRPGHHRTVQNLDQFLFLQLFERVHRGFGTVRGLELPYRHRRHAISSARGLRHCAEPPTMPQRATHNEPDPWVRVRAAKTVGEADASGEHGHPAHSFPPGTRKSRGVWRPPSSWPSKPGTPPEASTSRG